MLFTTLEGNQANRAALSRSQRTDPEYSSPFRSDYDNKFIRSLTSSDERCGTPTPIVSAPERSGPGPSRIRVETRLASEDVFDRSWKDDWPSRILPIETSDENTNTAGPLDRCDRLSSHIQCDRVAPSLAEDEFQGIVLQNANICLDSGAAETAEFVTELPRDLFFAKQHTTKTFIHQKPGEMRRGNEQASAIFKAPHSRLTNIESQRVRLPHSFRSRCVQSVAANGHEDRGSIGSTFDTSGRGNASAHFTVKLGSLSARSNLRSSRPSDIEHIRPSVSEALLIPSAKDTVVMPTVFEHEAFIQNKFIHTSSPGYLVTLLLPLGPVHVSASTFHEFLWSLSKSLLADVTSRRSLQGCPDGTSEVEHDPAACRDGEEAAARIEEL